jgi:hypothetical protein
MNLYQIKKLHSKGNNYQSEEVQWEKILATCLSDRLTFKVHEELKKLPGVSGSFL